MGKKSIATKQTTDATSDSATELAVRAERERCANWCERMAVLFDESATKLRKDGQFPGQQIQFKWPFIKTYYFVHHNWEKYARQKDDAAAACRTIKLAILENWRPKENSVANLADENE